MDKLLGIGLIFNALSNMISPNRGAYTSLFQPYFAPTYYYPSYTYYPQPLNYYNQPPINLVGNTLSSINLNDLQQPAISNSTLFNIANQKPNTDINLVGNTLMSLNSPGNEVSNFAYPSSNNYIPMSPMFTPNMSYTPTGTNSNSLSLTAIATGNRTKPQGSEPLGDLGPIGPVGNDARIQRTGNKVKPSKDVINRVKQIAQRINCDYKDLLGLIFCESSFQTVHKNWDGKSAIGLIQFTDICIRDLNQTYGTNYTKAQIARMDALEQLDLAEKALIRAKSVAGFSSSHRLTASELYAMNFVPKNAQKNIVAQRGDSYYGGNEGLDLNRDGKITQAELSEKVRKGKLSVIC